MKIITENDILKAQEDWAKAIVLLSQEVNKENYNIEDLAYKLVSELYAYDIGKVLFKPTLAKVSQFRGTKEKALFYFLGKNSLCAEDKGFLNNNWYDFSPYLKQGAFFWHYCKVRFENYDIILGEGSAQAMGNYFFINDLGEELKVEYTIGYILDTNDNLRINIHHSSLPYQGT